MGVATTPDPCIGVATTPDPDDAADRAGGEVGCGALPDETGAMFAGGVDCAATPGDAGAVFAGGAVRGRIAPGATTAGPDDADMGEGDADRGVEVAGGVGFGAGGAVGWIEGLVWSGPAEPSRVTGPAAPARGAMVSGADATPMLPVPG